jgi:hypothetical protein
LPGLSWGFASGLTLNHDIKVDKLVSERAHVVLEAKRVFSDCVGCEDKVSVALTLPIKDDLVVGVLYFIVDVE